MRLLPPVPTIRLETSRVTSAPRQTALDTQSAMAPSLTADDSEVSDDAIEQQLAEIVAAQLDKMQRGESLDMEALIAQYPTLTKEIHEVWPALLLADVAGHCATVDQEPTSSQRGFGSVLLGSDQTPEAFPSRMGDYELVEQIGRGGMGVVFKAKQLSLGRMVAVKMIQRERLSSELERKRFWQKHKPQRGWTTRYRAGIRSG